MAIILITGGARSGKSLRAEARARVFPGQPVYIATAEALDAEMAERIAKHRARRGQDWIEREAPLDLVQALIETDGRGARLVDCLTLWLSNLLLAERNWSKEFRCWRTRCAARAARSSWSPTRSGSVLYLTMRWRAHFAMRPAS